MLNSINGKIFSSLLLLTIIALIPAHAFASAPNFTGKWKLNLEMSDKLRDGAARKAPEKPLAAPNGQMQPDQKPVTKPFPFVGEILTIVHEGAEISITPAMEQKDRFLDGPNSAIPVEGGDNSVRIALPPTLERTFYTDGRAMKQKLEFGELIEIKAQLESGKLVVTENLPFGGKKIETYELSSNGKQLFVTTQIESAAGGENLPLFRRTYDRIGN